MKALVTGASEGIGRDIARKLSEMGYDLILVSRSEDKLNTLREELKTEVQIFASDLSSTDNCKRLYENYKDQDIDILVNNAGFGVYGEFSETDLDSELNMLDLNIKALHTLTKLFLKDFIRADKGYIMNVSSYAAFVPGPMHAGYYASKSYVLRVTEAIYEELRRRGSKVFACAFCPGPVTTGFNKRAGAGFAVKGHDSKYVAEYALERMFKHKLIIIPGAMLRFIRVLEKVCTEKFLLKMTYALQMKRTIDK